jgi:hypothetical protein
VAPHSLSGGDLEEDPTSVKKKALRRRILHFDRFFILIFASCNIICIFAAVKENSKNDLPETDNTSARHYFAPPCGAEMRWAAVQVGSDR